MTLKDRLAYLQTQDPDTFEKFIDEFSEVDRIRLLCEVLISLVDPPGDE